MGSSAGAGAAPQDQAARRCWCLPRAWLAWGCLGNIVTEFWRSFSRVGPLSAGLGGPGGGGGRESSSLADYWDGVTAREEGAE